MTGDDKHDEDGLDPWAELESAENPNLDPEGGFEQPEAEQSDALVSDWLTDDTDVDGDASAPLGVFVPDELPDETPDQEPDGVPDLAGFLPESIEVDAADDPADGVGHHAVIADMTETGVEATDDSEQATAATVVPVTLPPEPSVRKKKGGWGQLAGVVFGGLLAIPVTLGILIWGLRQDPLNLVKHVPESAAFLFPAELRGSEGRSLPPPVGDVMAPTLDDVPVVAVDEPPMPDASQTDDPELGSGDTADTASVPDAVDLAVTVPPNESEPESPVMQPDGDKPDSSAATEPPDGLSLSEPAAVEPSTGSETAMPDDTAVAAVAPADSHLPDPLEVPAPIVPAEPTMSQSLGEPAGDEGAPLDFAPIEESAASARTALEALAAVDREPHVATDPARDRERTVLLVDWYRQLAAVAEAHAGLERAAADFGRPLAGSPEALRAVQREIVADPGRLEQLARLSRNWFSYPGRQTSGVMLPAVMAGTRQVGPYWCSTVTMAEADGRTRDIAVVSRTEPAAVPGDAVLVTGLIIDGDVVWASDVGPATQEGLAAAGFDAAAEAESATEPPVADPFAAPDP